MFRRICRFLDLIVAYHVSCRVLVLGGSTSLQRNEMIYVRTWHMDILHLEQFEIVCESSKKERMSMGRIWSLCIYRDARKSGA